MKQIGATELWKNNLYTVNVRRHIKHEGFPDMTWLSIKRNDKHPLRDWRHFQWIKNQLVGEECEGVELYPKESRLVDGSNQYHIWVLEDPKITFPFGFHEGRQVSERPFVNGKQRAWPENMKPKDLEEQERLLIDKIKEYNQKHNTNFKVQE
jgi:hypothetical protein